MTNSKGILVLGLSSLSLYSEKKKKSLLFSRCSQISGLRNISYGGRGWTAAPGLISKHQHESFANWPSVYE